MKTLLIYWYNIVHYSYLAMASILNKNGSIDINDWCDCYQIFFHILSTHWIIIYLHPPWVIITQIHELTYDRRDLYASYFKWRCYVRIEATLMMKICLIRLKMKSMKIYHSILALICIWDDFYLFLPNWWCFNIILNIFYSSPFHLQNH